MLHEPKEPVVRLSLRNPIASLRYVWQLAKNERAEPRAIGWAVAVGVFVGCTPALGLHGGIAVAAATLLRLNRLWAFLGSRVSAFFILPFITYAEVELAHILRTGAWVTLDREHVVDQAKELLLDWCIGTLPVGGALAVALGLAAYAVARRRASIRAAATEDPDTRAPS
jgi:uncharacterized protein (DUF2062 family)